MRVVITCDWFLKYAAEQSAALARAGADVLLLCREHAHEFGGDAGERDATLSEPYTAGVRIVQLPGRLWEAPGARALGAVRRAVRRLAPDVVHAHDGADVRALAVLAGLPTVLTLHDPLPHPGQPVPPWHKRWLLHGSRDAWRRRARVIVVHSDYLRDGVRLLDGQRCAVLPHGLRAHAAALAPPPAPAVVLFGRLTPYKGLDVLARAMPRVWERRPEVRLSVAGAGEEAFELVDERVDVQRRYVPESELREILSRASLAVLPYTDASQTGVGSVAVGYGVPIVVSRVGGLPDLALDPSYVVTPGDPEELAGAIVRHVDDGPEVRRRVLSEVAGPHTWDAVAQRSLELYRELADSGRA